MPAAKLAGTVTSVDQFDSSTSKEESSEPDKSIRIFPLSTALSKTLPLTYKLLPIYSLLTERLAFKSTVSSIMTKPFVTVSSLR